MSTLTDADQARGLTEPEGDARDLAAKLADARRLAESAARTAARLTRERDEARESLAWWTEVQPCDMRHSEPFDFGGCETHDRTFPLGGACDHAGLSEVEWMEQREQEQRVRAIRAEEERGEARAVIEAVRALHSPVPIYPLIDAPGSPPDTDAEPIATVCSECTPQGVIEAIEDCCWHDSSDDVDHPCPTIRTLGS